MGTQHHALVHDRGKNVIKQELWESSGHHDLQWELHHSSGQWKFGLILIFTIQSVAMGGKHLNMHKMLYLKLKWLDV